MNHRALCRLLMSITMLLAGARLGAEEPTGAAGSGPIVRIDSGRIAGAMAGGDDQVQVFKGIPFAAPPVGDLRWKPPQPVRPWNDVRPCLAFGPACPQPKVPIISDEITRTSEDLTHSECPNPRIKCGSPRRR